MELHGHESQNHIHHLSMIFVEFLYCKISMLSKITENNYVIFRGDTKPKKICVFSTEKKHIRCVQVTMGSVGDEPSSGAETLVWVVGGRPWK